MSNRDTLFSTPIANIGKWTFNEQITKVFPDMIQRSIPGYSDIISIIGILAERFVQPGTKVYDLGCSVGSAALSVWHNVYHDDYKIIAIDNSSAMIKHCRQYINKYNASKLIEVIEGDIRDISIKSASMVILNFTLQFLNPDDKQTLLNKIYQGINSQGILILSEKFNFEDIIVDKLLFNMHHNFKRANGYSELEISQKHNMLKNIMLTDSVKTHKSRLQKAGFKHSELYFQYFNFGSLIALKDDNLI